MIPAIRKNRPNIIRQLRSVPTHCRTGIDVCHRKEVSLELFITRMNMFFVACVSIGTVGIVVGIAKLLKDMALRNWLSIN